MNAVAIEIADIYGLDLSSPSPAVLVLRSDIETVYSLGHRRFVPLYGKVLLLQYLREFSRNPYAND